MFNKSFFAVHFVAVPICTCSTAKPVFIKNLKSGRCCFPHILAFIITVYCHTCCFFFSFHFALCHPCSILNIHSFYRRCSFFYLGSLNNGNPLFFYLITVCLKNVMRFFWCKPYFIIDTSHRSRYNVSK